MSLGTLIAPILTPIVYVLAVARVTRLFNHDSIVNPLRIAVGRRAREDGRSVVEQRRWRTVEYFLGCPWCLGMWLAIGTAWLPLYFADNPVVQYVGVGLAVSMIIGLAAPLSYDDPIDIEPDDD